MVRERYISLQIRLDLNVFSKRTGGFADTRESDCTARLERQTYPRNYYKLHQMFSNLANFSERDMHLILSNVISTQ